MTGESGNKYHIVNLSIAGSGHWTEREATGEVVADASERASRFSQSLAYLKL